MKIIQALLLALLVMATNGAIATCNPFMLTGSWAFVGYGQYPSNTSSNSNSTNQTITTQSINIIGIIRFEQGNQITEGWVTVKAGSLIADITNLTGKYTVRKPCVAELNVSADNGYSTFASYRGTISLDGRHIDLIGLNPKETVVLRMDRLESCDPNSLRGVWTASSLRQYPVYSVANLETIDCTKSRKWCTFWELGDSDSPYGINATQVNVTSNPDGKHPCMWSFQNGSVADGYIAVPFGDGMNVIQGTPKYSLATTYYQGAR